MLCVGPKTVARWAKAGKLNSVPHPRWSCAVS